MPPNSIFYLPNRVKCHTGWTDSRLSQMRHDVRSWESKKYASMSSGAQGSYLISLSSFASSKSECSLADHWLLPTDASHASAANLATAKRQANVHLFHEIQPNVNCNAALGQLIHSSMQRIKSAPVDLSSRSSTINLSTVVSSYSLTTSPTDFNGSFCC